MPTPGQMLDAIAEQSAAGMEVVRGCHEYEIKANYKLICENSYDGYHLELTHIELRRLHAHDGAAASPCRR